MEQILFSSQELDLNFTLSDHSISSDEELISINYYKTQRKTKSEEEKVNDNSSHESETKSSNSGEKPKNWPKSQSKQLVAKDKSEISGRTTYYKECPLCRSLGPKSINHIKQCANKRSIDPKRVVQLLAKCQKTEQPVNCHRTRFNSKQTKRSNKLKDNYVISFGDKKQMKITIDPKMVSNKSVKHLQNKYVLLSLDPMERHRLLMSKINDQMQRYDDQKGFNDNLLNSFCILPDIWRLSSLDSDSDKYFVEGFQKYEKSSTFV